MLCLCLLPACGDSNGDEPDNPNPINPDKEVADPAGTVKLSMRSEAAVGDAKTILDDMLYIDGADNFCIREYSSASSIIDLGSMKGLGNIEYIPKTGGWAEKVKVTPGHGYLIFYYDNSIKNSTYYRIYVCNYIKNAVGEIIGADIKYQKPFHGIDEVLKPNEKSLTISPYESEAYIYFDNSSIIPFAVDIIGYKPNFSSQKFSAWADDTTVDGDRFRRVRLQSYYYNGYSTVDYQFGFGFEAKLRLTTLYGKTTIVNIQTKNPSEDDE